MSEYNHIDIEKKWRNEWRDQKTYKTFDDYAKEKYYVLDMFPYPSGAGLHVGHPLGYIASDIVARYKRNKGFNVLHPMGYDSFGLPAEQYAIQTGQHPAITTEQNIARYREQLDKIGFSFDWDREVRTSDPNYYKWTQSIFKEIYNSWYNKTANKSQHIDTLIQLFEKEGNANIEAVCEETAPFTSQDWNSWDAKKQQSVLMNYRLAFLADSWVNWCPALGTVLANDEIKDGVSERGGHPVEQKLMRQWSMRITAYAERLLEGLEKIDFSDSLKEQQRNWIGKSKGAMVRFDIDGLNSHQPSSINHHPYIEVFTTRPDTIFGVSFMVLAPEQALVDVITTAEQKEHIENYKKLAAAKSERDRQANVKNITGAFTGAYAVHPFTGNKIQIWIGDYVLATYGTGAVMAVPAGDQRDWDFATHFGIEIPNIFKDTDISKEACADKTVTLTHSDFLNGLTAQEGIEKAIEAIEKKGIGKGKINYRLRDAIFSRQRYWGEPFPVYYQDDVPHLIDDADLPVTLPEVDKYLPTEDGEPPLARAEGWVYKTSPHPSPMERGRDSAPRGYEVFDEDEGIDLVEEDSPEGFYKTTDQNTWFRLKEKARDNRKEQTPAEKIIWHQIRNTKLGVRFRRQQVINNYIVDFVAFSSKLVLEIDGEYHNSPEQQEYDEKRTKVLNELGFKVIRFTNDQVFENLHYVIETINTELKLNNPQPTLPIGEGQGGVFRMEYNTMPGWAGSSWYFLRYMDPHNEQTFVSKEKADYWQQVDLYIGGAEHATGHLLYSRFWTKFLFDMGYISFDEPFKKLINQGMILGRSSFVYRDKYNSDVFVSKNILLDYHNQNPPTEKNDDKDVFIKGSYLDRFNVLHADISLVDNDILDFESFKNWREEYKNAKFILEDGKYICGSEIEKMSKSKYNVQTPDELVEKFGADTLRCYEMFLGPLEQFKPWDVKGINGVNNFLKKLWRLFHQGGSFTISEGAPSSESLKTVHKTIKKVTEDIDRYSFNTVVSTMMICVNELTDQKCNNRQVLSDVVVLLSPYAPHLAEEIWQLLGNTASVTKAPWPAFNEAFLVESSINYPISFNGKVRFTLSLPADMPREEVEKVVMAEAKTQQYLEGNAIKKMIVVPGKIVNIVV
jgi:leucyl-tRNA synthetase/very-short-patch-repair endonuclease